MRYRFSDDLAFGAAAQDITGTLISYSNNNKDTVNPTLKLGTALGRSFGDFRGTALGDADIRFEGRVRSAQFSQNWISADTHLGFELAYSGVAFVRLGSDIGNLTTGIGVKFSRFRVDLALLDHSDLDTSYRGSLVVNW